MRIKHHYLTNINNKDCWTHALSLAFDKDYDNIRHVLGAFIEEDGSINTSMIMGALEHKNFYISDLNNLSVRDVVIAYNSYDNHIVIGTKNHVFYVSDMMVYDTTEKEKFEQLLNAEVEYIGYKQKEVE